MPNFNNKFVRLANWLLSTVLSDKYLEEFLGDLHEIYQERRNVNGVFVANIFYWIDAFHLLIGFSSFHIFRSQTDPTIMLRHYFTIAGRNIFRNKTSSMINILGLSVGLGVCLLIYQYIFFESTYDRFHQNSFNKYRLIQHDIKDGNDLGLCSFSTFALGESCKEEIPEVDQFVRIRPMDIGLVMANVDKHIIFQENKIWYVDSNFLEFFDFPLLAGSKEIALNEKHNIAITENVAKRYFGDSNPIGKSLKISGGVYSGDFEVTAVLKNPPSNSHLQFDILLNIGFFFDHWVSYYEEGDTGWVNNDFITYISTNENADDNFLQVKINEVLKNNASERLAFSDLNREIIIQPIPEIHLNSTNVKREFAINNGNLEDIKYFTIIAIFIMFMAWVNYINLSTARALSRSKEVGIKKSIGAIKRQLISQFLIESLLMNLLSTFLAIGIAYTLLPLLTMITGREMHLEILYSHQFWLWFSTLILLGSFLSGLYPAFILSSFKPISILKGNNSKRSTGYGLRRGLITFQFLISVLLISGTYLVYKQIHYLKNKDLGLDVEKILVLDGPRVVLETLKAEGTTLEAKHGVFIDKVMKHHSISEAAVSSSVPSKGHLFHLDFRKSFDAKTSGIETDVSLVGPDFFNTYGLKFLEYDSLLKVDSPITRIIINESAIKSFGFKSAKDAFHQQIFNDDDPFEIAGVIRDFDWESPRFAKKPIVFLIDNTWGAFISLRLNLSNVQESIAYIKSTFNEVFPDDPFNYYFLDEEFNNQYKADLQFGKLLNVFSILAIFIACLGLFALVTYSTMMKVKEIGIRKIFGASIPNIAILLSKEYIIILSISILTAIPGTIFIGNHWLNNFANKTNMGLDVFLLPALLLFSLTIITVGFKIYSLARMNPANSLRTE